MGRSNRHKCPKCGAKDATVTHTPKWKPEYVGQPPYYEDGIVSVSPRTNKAEHLRIQCGECNYEWTKPIASSIRTTK